MDPTSSANKFDDELNLPKATLVQLIKESLPQGLRATQQSCDLISQLTAHFLTHLASNSNDLCNDAGKKTISHQHVGAALKKMKMDSILAKILELDLPQNESELNLTEKETQKLISKQMAGKMKKKKKRGFNPNTGGLTEEQLLEEQKKLFD